MKVRIFLLLSAAAFSHLAQASIITPAKRPAAPVLLRGGEVHTVSGAVLTKTDVLLKDGKIAQIGAALPAPAGGQVINIAGLRVYPGLISADTTIGLEEIGALRQTTDTAEVGAINPDARALVAVKRSA